MRPNCRQLCARCIGFETLSMQNRRVFERVGQREGRSYFLLAWVVNEFSSRVG